MSSTASRYAGEWSVFYASRVDCQNKLFPAPVARKWRGASKSFGNRAPTPLGFQISSAMELPESDFLEDEKKMKIFLHLF
jgi:hypothetical protein